MYQFGPFCVDPEQRLMSHDGTPLNLTRKVVFRSNRVRWKYSGWGALNSRFLSISIRSKSFSYCKVRRKLGSEEVIREG